MNVFFTPDYRTIKKNDLFIPICGKNFDGHNFINEVSKKGVKACLIEKKKTAVSTKQKHTQNHCK